MNGAAAEFRIAADTQQRVLKAAALLNYEPNTFARSLRSKRSYTIGVMVPEISEGYSALVLGGLEDTLLQEEFFYFVVSHRHRQDLLQGYPRLLLARSVEGLIAVDTPICEPLPVPVVSVSGHHHAQGILNIELDHQAAAQLALSHLRDLGHRRIAFIRGQSFSSDTRPRWDAIRRVCAKLDLRIDPALVAQLEGVEPGSRPGYEAMQKLIAAGRRFTAVFAFNDVTAMGAIAALHEAGLHIPRDVSVVGFDDIPAAATMHPGLTTVHQPLREMGQTAAASLLRLIRSTESHTQLTSVLVAPAFVRRHSTAKPASA